MVHKIILAICLLTQIASVSCKVKNPVPVIFDSDMGPDYDDVGAIALLHAMADSGYATILATVASTKYEGVAGVFDVFNTYFKRPGILIGVPKGKASDLRDGQHWTDTILGKYPHSVIRNDEVPDATEVYRKVLASQPDKSVTIVTTGFLTNLFYLLQSAPDKYSNLDGKNLVKQKVKQLVCMAGGFPAFSEFNVKIDAAASKFVFNNWDTPIIFSGFEIGWKIRTGLPLVNNTMIANSPVKDVFRISIPMNPEDSAGRMSWDQTAVLVAIKGHGPWYRIEKGKIVVADDGSNTWAKEPPAQGYLVEAQSHLIVQELINKLMMHQPIER
ncbi:MAG TPA: nucleoside hydrolase [Chitinophagaceae bacterium]|nr:nucleoside hydrolase [Chitinophagaceae bacterium]